MCRVLDWLLKSSALQHTCWVSLTVTAGTQGIKSAIRGTKCDFIYNNTHIVLHYNKHAGWSSFFLNPEWYWTHWILTESHESTVDKRTPSINTCTVCSYTEPNIRNTTRDVTSYNPDYNSITWSAHAVHPCTDHKDKHYGCSDSAQLICFHLAKWSFSASLCEPTRTLAGVALRAGHRPARPHVRNVHM